MPTCCKLSDDLSGSAKALSLQMRFRVRCYIAFQFRIDSFLHVVCKLIQSARFGRRPVGVSCIRRIVGASVSHGITSHGLVFRKKVRVSHRRRSIDPKASDQISPMHFPFDMICLPIGEVSNCFCRIECRHGGEQGASRNKQIANSVHPTVSVGHRLFRILSHACPAARMGHQPRRLHRMSAPDFFGSGGLQDFPAAKNYKMYVWRL